MDHCFLLCETVLSSRIWRDEVLNILVDLHSKGGEPNYTYLCRCFFYLGNPKAISDILWELIQSDKTELIAFQVAFDLTEYQNERFQRAIFDGVPRPPSDAPPPAASQRQPPAAQNADGYEAIPELDEDGDVAMEENAQKESADPPTVGGPSIEWEEPLKQRWTRLREILLGDIIIPLQVDFLCRNNHSDLFILKQIKESISERSPILNNALVCANAMMHSGTTIDQFLRDNLDWMSRAAHWAKFVSTASLGMIHYHHVDSSEKILERYLPGTGGGPYQEGGSLYAMGLIHCGDNSEKTSGKIHSYLVQELKKASNEILQL